MRCFTVIAVVDSERYLGNLSLPDAIQNWINEDSARDNVKLVVFPDKGAFLESWQRRDLFDLVFFTVHSAGDGYGLAKIIRQRDAKIRLVGVTNEREMVWDSFEWSLWGFLLVPLQDCCLIECLARAYDRNEERRNHIFVDRDGSRYIEHASTSYIQIKSGIISAFDRFSDTSVQVTLTDLSEQLPINFFRVKKNKYVNLMYTTDQLRPFLG